MPSLWGFTETYGNPRAAVFLSKNVMKQIPRKFQEESREQEARYRSMAAKK
jgi:hypothetical protein